MRIVIPFSLAAALLLAAGALLADQAKDEKGAGQKKIKPVPAQAGFELKVETKPRFPNENRPAASEPAEVKSLSVTIQPEKKSFAGNGPLSFLVTLENKSKTPLLLYGLEHLGASPKLVISNLTNANQWMISGDFTKAKDQAAVQLGAGESKTYTLVVEANVVFPRPIPLPRPLPMPMPIRPLPAPALKKALPEQPAANAPKILRRRPIVVGPALPCGAGPCRARLFLEFQTDPHRRYQTPQWTGKIATGTVDFEVGKWQPIGQPPIVGGPMTKPQAIKLAQAAAERALQSNYQPVPGIKPDHQGTWITNAEKTATVTENKTGGWAVSWTEFPKTGFSYNVKVDVSSNGTTIIREVFTGYKK